MRDEPTRQARPAWMASLAIAAALLASCGSDGSDSSTPTPVASPTPTTTPTPTPTPTPSPTPTPVALTHQQIYARPVMARVYEQTQWTLKGGNGSGPRETVASAAAAIAALKPSYVSGLIYMHSGSIITPQMAADFQTIRNTVLAENPNAKFDVEISLNPTTVDGTPFASADALVALMTTINTTLHPDGYWMDYYSSAAKVDPDWITAAVNYAHANGQLIGGNVYDSSIPAGSDAVAFVDDIVSGSQYGFDFNSKEVAALRAEEGSTILLGHLQSNPQNQAPTESCVYTQQWTEAQRAAYLNYWASQQSALGYTFMYPVFYPLCPTLYSFDPELDNATNGGTLYSYIQALIAQYNP